MSELCGGCGRPFPDGTQIPFRELLNSFIRYYNAIRAAARPNASDPETLRQIALLRIQQEFGQFGISELIDWSEI